MLSEHESARARPVSSHFYIEELAPGVYTAIAEEGGAAGANAGIIDLGGITLVFDTMLTPLAAGELRDVAEFLFQRPVSLVVNSHDHRAHIRGNQVFGPQTEIIATRRTRELVAARAMALVSQDAATAPARLAQLESARAGELDDIRRAALEHQAAELQALITSLPGLQPRAPTRSFETRRSLAGSARSAVLMSLGGGHSPGDAFLYLPDERIGFLGDLLAVGRHPALAEGDVNEWRWILDQIELLDLQLLVPGHGPPGTATDLALTRAYLDLLQALAAPGDQPGLLAIPAPFAEWRGAERFAANLAAIRAHTGT